MKRVDVVNVLIFDESRMNVLMVRNQKGDETYWSLPGGAVEPGETLEQAGRREAKEESGYDVHINELYAVSEVFFANSGHHALIFTFHAEIVGGEMAVADPDEDIVEVKWVDVAAANEIFANLSVKMTISAESPFAGYSFYGTV